ncbi:MAG: SUMF1/EgtB/PvdO family nonheme iron enzyme [Phycisphaerae bacterium]|nr:SUMF1/EgtB/PvdO family nonheme iron enzyme [Phycisphaerae bacterium]
MAASDETRPGDSSWNEKEVFLRALTFHGAEREAYLKEACPDDAALERIRSLIEHHQQADEDLLSVSVNTTETSAELPSQIEEFKIIRKLGEGGMGVVYLAEDAILGRRVALKVLARHKINSEHALARFREEARSAAALKHPAIVPVFKFGQSGEDYFIVSELVEGQTLAGLIQSKRNEFRARPHEDARDWHKQAAEILAVIADALDCAHRAGIVHRDVKPSNILLDHDRGPRLTDFGIAKHVNDEVPSPHSGVIGTVHYMSPEQAAIAETQVDQRSDIFSLGIVLYELLSFRLPFDGPTIHQVLQAVMYVEPQKLRTIDRSIAQDLETICHKALEKQPHDRYQTAAHIAADLRCYLTNDPILARPPGLKHRIVRYVRRHRRRVVAGVIAALLAAIALLSWNVVAQTRRSMSHILATCEDQDARLWVRPIGGSTASIPKSMDMGNLPVKFDLPTGLYRLTATSGDGFSEATLLITTTGDERTIEMPPPKLIPNDPNMAYFEAGQVMSGVPGRTGSQSLRAVQLDPFYIDLAEVSNAEYRRFVEATGHRRPIHWDNPDFEPGLDDRPVVGVTWDDANAYCRFVRKRLPTADEWEHAMRWPDGRLVPWGSQSPTELRITSIDAAERSSSINMSVAIAEYIANTRPVRSDQSLQSSVGLFHGATNVSEFTETVVSEIMGQVVLKGASWANLPDQWDLANSRSYPMEVVDASGRSQPAWSMKIGFRCARSALHKPRE